MPIGKVWANVPLAVELRDAGDAAQSLPLTAFGDLRVAELTPMASWSFIYNVNQDLVKQTTTGSGTVTQSNSKVTLQTGTTGNSSARIETINVVRYTPGLGNLLRFTAVFSTGAAGSTQIVGVGDQLDGFFFGYNGSTFGVFRRQNGVDTFTPQTAWNCERFDGTGRSTMLLNPTAGNVYTIAYQWLGYGNIRFLIEDANTGVSLLAHQIRYPNTSTDPSIFNPTLPIMAEVANTSNTTNLSLQSPSATAFVEGPGNNLSTATRNAITGSKTAVSTEVAILTIQNKLTYQGKTNRVRIQIDMLSLSVNGTQPAELRLVRSATLGGTPSFSDVSTNTSVVAWDTAATTVSGGTQLACFLLSTVTSEQLLVDTLGLFLAPGDTLTVAATSAAATDVKVSMSWREFF